MGIDANCLPDVKNTGEYIGDVLSDIADELGINKDTKVVISSYDAICSFIGSGVNDEGESSDVSGTVTVFRTLTRKETCKSSKIYSMPYYNENAKIIGGSNNLGGGLIEWVKQCYYLNDEYPYEIMEKDAAESDIGARGLVFLPFLLGERAPIWDDNARGVSRDQLWVKEFHIWMRGMTAQWMGVTGSHANSVAPLLISTEQGYLKSTFCKSLLPPALQRYYMDKVDLTSQGRICERRQGHQCGI